MNDLKPWAKKLQKWQLIGLMYIVGLPAHVLIGMWHGAKDGWSDFLHELETLKKFPHT